MDNFIINQLKKRTKYIYFYKGKCIALFAYQPFNKIDEKRYFYVDSYYFVSHSAYMLCKSLGIKQYNGNLKGLIEEAGIGVRLKNDLMCVSGLGSYFYIVAFDFEYDEGMEFDSRTVDRVQCLNCGLCVRACPRGCIVPFDIKNNCIRALAGTDEFDQLGCNICQRVCPLNAAIKSIDAPADHLVPRDCIDYANLACKIGTNMARKKFFKNAKGHR